jgi:histidine kinase-like protein
MTAHLRTLAGASPPIHYEFAVIRCLHGERPERDARHLVTRVLAGTVIGADLPDVEVAVCELVSNARQHAPGPYELRILLGQTSVKIAVLDGGADHAELARKLRTAAADRLTDGESGRGLQIVAGLFPGTCGAVPAPTSTGRATGRQAWITAWLTDGQAPDDHDYRERKEAWLTTRLAAIPPLLGCSSPTS